MPDLFFPAGKHGYYGMFIEMKFGKNGTTDAQDKWIAQLKERGYFVQVCYGFEDARKVIDWYFKED